MANPKPFTLEEHPTDEYAGLKVSSLWIERLSKVEIRNVVG